MTSLLVVLPLAGKDFWLEKEYTEWSKKECRKMLENSPWAERQIIRYPIITPGTGIRGEKEFRVDYVVRFLSALPIRQALVQQAKLEANYESLSEQERGQIDQQAKSYLEADFRDVVVFTVDFYSNVPEYQSDTFNYWSRHSTDTLRGFAYLIAHGKERVPLLRFDPPPPNVPRFRLLFPRRFNGEQVISPEDKEVVLQLTPPGTPQGGAFGFRSRFKTKKMTYSDELTY